MAHKPALYRIDNYERYLEIKRIMKRGDPANLGSFSERGDIYGDIAADVAREELGTGRASKEAIELSIVLLSGCARLLPQHLDRIVRELYPYEQDVL